MVAETVEVSNEAACSALLALLSEYSLSSSSSSLSSASVYALEAGGHALGKLVVLPVWWCTIWSRGVREHALPSLLDRAMASVCIAQAWLRLYSTALLCVRRQRCLRTNHAMPGQHVGALQGCQTLEVV